MTDYLVFYLELSQSCKPPNICLFAGKVGKSAKQPKSIILSLVKLK